MLHTLDVGIVHYRYGAKGGEARQQAMRAAVAGEGALREIEMAEVDT
jgi:hypothetical protein